MISNTIRLVPALVAMLGACAVTPPPPPDDALAREKTMRLPHSGDAWFREGQDVLTAKQRLVPNNGLARNVILFIGDGMSPDTTTAARILAGQLAGATGEENLLSFERFPYTALAKTYTTDRQVPDSAGTATAMLSGVKTRSGVIGVDGGVVLDDCPSGQARSVPTFLELAEQQGLATGVVTTTRITHATPAAAYAHVPSRGWEHDTMIPANHAACKDIAVQLVEFDHGNGIEVAFGGGRANFLPKDLGDVEYPTVPGLRADGRNLIEEWVAKTQGRFVWDMDSFTRVGSGDGPVLGLFEPSHMQFEADRAAGKGAEPSLAEMTAKAIEILKRERAGFFLLVEGGRIDHAHHAGNAARSLHDTIAFADAIAAAHASTNDDDTLIIVTADHGHVMSISGYPERGNPILGKVATSNATGKLYARDRNGMPYTTLSYANGPGAREDPTRRDLTGVDTENLDYLQDALVPMDYETHSGGDVAVYADGPGAHLFSGVVEQNFVFHVMYHAARLYDPR